MRKVDTSWETTTLQQYESEIFRLYENSRHPTGETVDSLSL